MFLPRLPANRDGTIDVPRYSDFRRHKMGSNLVQLDPPQTDDSGNPLPNDEWLIIKLWGVADTEPYLHDGRARTLKEAILYHEGPGSEANQVIQAFTGLDEKSQGKIITFLESLRLPADPPIFRQKGGFPHPKILFPFPKKGFHFPKERWAYVLQRAPPVPPAVK